MTAESVSVPDRKLRILVVEDEPLIAMMLAQMLNELGCEYIGPIGIRKTALECARTEEMDAAILNLVIGVRRSTKARMSGACCRKYSLIPRKPY